MLISVCREIRNFFVVEKEQGNFSIQNETLSGFKGYYPKGRHLLIERRTGDSFGSLYNAGLYLIDETFPVLTGTKDEEWQGKICLCDFPSDFLMLVEEIKAYVEKTPQTSFESESFGAYRYQTAANKDGVPVSWNEVYRSRLTGKYNKMFMEEHI